MLSMSSYSCHISNSLKCDLDCSHTSLWAEAAFLKPEWPLCWTASPTENEHHCWQLLLWVEIGWVRPVPWGWTSANFTWHDLHLCPLILFSQFYSQSGLHRVQHCETILPFSPLILMFPLESSSLELISGFLLKCSLFFFALWCDLCLIKYFSFLFL